MFTLGDFGSKAMTIRRAANELEVRGAKNCALVKDIDTYCQEIIDMINEAVREIQNGSTEESGEHVEQNSGASGPDSLGGSGC